MKTKIKKSRSAIVALAVVLTIGAFFAFTPVEEASPPPSNSKVGYDLEVTTRYLLPDGTDVESLSNLDLNRLKEHTLRMHVEKELGNDGFVTTTVTQIEDSQKEPWMKNPGKIVYDPNGVRMYDSNGQLIQQRDYDPEELQSMEMELVDPNLFGKQALLKPLNSNQISQIQSQGVAVTVDSPVEVTFRNGPTEVIQNAERLSLDRRFYENEEIKYRRQSKFLPTADGAHMIPHVNIQRTRETLPGGLCIEKMEIERFHNYKINGVSPTAYMAQGAEEETTTNGQTLATTKQNKSEGKEVFRLYPNPAQNEVFVQLENLGKQGTLQLQIINLLGKSVYEQQVSSEEQAVSINIEHLPTGTYFIQLKQGDAQWSRRFVKQ